MRASRSRRYSSVMPSPRVALLAVNPWNSPGPLQPFSYAAYRLLSALTGQGIEAKVFDGRGLSLDVWQAQIEAFAPTVIGASAYVWSLPLFVPLLKALKEQDPRRLIVLGGPSARPAMLAQPPCAPLRGVVDALVTGAGEGPIVDIALSTRENLSDIPGILLPKDGGWTPTAHRHEAPFDSLRSPFMADVAPPNVSAHLQTFTGCPMSCSFCAWGTDSGVSPHHSKAWLVEELRAFQRHGVQSVLSVDAALNLHPRAFTALYEAEAETGVLRDLDFNTELYPSLVTPQMEEFLRHTRPEIAVGLQSYDIAVLKKNFRYFKEERFESLIERLASFGRVVVEIIAGLPEDTPENFRRTIERLRPLPCNIRIFYCLALPDGLMTRATPEMELRYDPLSLQVTSCKGWSPRDLEAVKHWLDAEARASGGLVTAQWPLPVFERQEAGILGRVPEAPLWEISKLRSPESRRG